MSGAGVPTGCYKCGRPGHWARDCPSSSSTTPDPNPKSSNFLNSSSSSSFSKSAGTFSQGPVAAKSADKPKKVPKTRPKLTPELLLSNDGLGYILRHFPRNFKFRGRGHEVNDLKNLLRMYSEWHSQLLPYYPFDQFVHKVEQVGSSKRVKLCLRELRERIANGGDLATWKDPTTEAETALNEEEDVQQQQTSISENPKNQGEATTNPSSPKVMDINDQQEDLFNEFFTQTVQEETEALQSNRAENGNNSVEGSGNQVIEDGSRSWSKMVVSEEQKARMEVNRQKALERAMARKRSLNVS